ncbi:hypothetical protein [Parapedobacter indicus]|uniref:hypothetical protein n=1 Tax=Parapedobacter indicus TaxID=1477437 RepID=UPI0011607D5A|nr:hypothetical protein [Parapedobacter indicus]
MVRSLALSRSNIQASQKALPGHRQIPYFTQWGGVSYAYLVIAVIESVVFNSKHGSMLKSP